MPLLTSKPDDSHSLNLLFYGDTGVGKTWLAGTASLFGPSSPTLFVDIEGGTTTLAGMDVEVFRPNSWDDIQEVYNVLRGEDHGYGCVVIDSLTEVQRKLSLGFIMGELETDGDGYEDLGRSVPPDRQDWLRTGEQMRKFIRAFRDLAWQENSGRRLHVIMTALEKYVEKKRVMCPQLSGSLGPEAGAFFDVLGRLSVVEVEDEDGNLRERRHLLTSSYEGDDGTRYLAKNRGGKLGRQVWDPTVEKILGKWEMPTEEQQPRPKTQRKPRQRREEEPVDEELIA